MSWYDSGLVRACASLPASALATSWWTGDLSFRGDAGELGLDYAVRPLPVAEDVQTVLGVAGLVVLVLLWVLVLRALRTAPALLRLTLAGAYLGWAYRVSTAGGIGANIGAGLVELVGVPLLVALLGLAGGLAFALRPRTARP